MFSRREGEVPSRWASRKYCTRSCGTRAARPGRLKYDRSPKVCEECGKTFEAPPNQRGRTWGSRVLCSVDCVRARRRRLADSRRTVRTCPICGTKFKRAREDHRVVTCGKTECQVRYRREIRGPEQSERMKRQYASGERELPGRRERELWPFLALHGWQWSLRWADTFGSFELDFAHMERRLNVEIDGREHQADKGHRERDARRDAELERRGWRILRIANADVDESPERVAERVLAWADSAA